MSDDHPDKPAEPGEGAKPGPDMAELMFKLAEIRRSVPDADDTGRRLLKQGIILVVFLAVIILLPMLFSGSCNPAR